MKFGDRLKNARTEMNLTQEQVANDFFITRQTISSWENEKTYPDITSLIKLSDYYHILPHFTRYFTKGGFWNEGIFGKEKRRKIYYSNINHVDYYRPTFYHATCSQNY